MEKIYIQKLGVLFTIFILSLFSYSGFAQVGIGTTTPDINSLLDIDATAKAGGLLLPRLALRGANNPLPLSNPITNGMLIYNTREAGLGVNRVFKGVYYHDGTTWIRVGGPKFNWALDGNTGTDEALNYLGTTDNQSLRFRTDNSNRFEITKEALPSDLGGQLRAYSDGSEKYPTYSWNATYPPGFGMGMFRAGRNVLAFSTTGNEAMRILEDRRIAINRYTSINESRLTVWETATNNAIYGRSSNGIGVRGDSEGNVGVQGVSVVGRGVYGQSGFGYGVLGIATENDAHGGHFVNTKPQGYGLYAIGGGSLYYEIASSGIGAVINGREYGTTSFSTALNGMGIAGIGGNIGAIPAGHPLGVGVLGYGYQAGVYGDGTRYVGQKGVHGKARGGTIINGSGVYGENNAGSGYGVNGESTDVGVRGYGAKGALLESNANEGFGAVIWNKATSGADRIGLVVSGQNGTITSLAGTGASMTGWESGGAGFAEDARGTGLIGVGNDLTTPSLAATGSGVAGTGTDIGVYGHATSGLGYGVYSSGNLHATGNITTGGTITSLTGAMNVADAAVSNNIIVNNDVAISHNLSIGVTLTAHTILATDLTASGTKNFIIDDPRDPANKFLKHASIESNEILNLYRGVDTFNASGEALVQLPDYYDAINRNASYQLTPIGASMPNLYIATEVNNGNFRIAGGVAGKKVSWTITAERNDLYIRNNPESRNMEVDKGVERGLYLAPEAYGQTADKGILYNRSSEMLKASNHSQINKAVVPQEIQSITVSAKKLDEEQILKVKVPFESIQSEVSVTKELSGIPVIKAVTKEVSLELAEKVKETSSVEDLQSTENTKETSDTEQAPIKTLESQENN